MREITSKPSICPVFILCEIFRGFFELGGVFGDFLEKRVEGSIILEGYIREDFLEVCERKIGGFWKKK